jgi:hypothetical protein
MDALNSKKLFLTVVEARKSCIKALTDLVSSADTLASFYTVVLLQDIHIAEGVRAYSVLCYAPKVQSLGG